MSLRLDDISKSFGRITALREVSLELSDAESLALVGPSGCGKSTLLRVVAGLESPDSGSVSLGARDVTRVPPQRRDVGMVFQDYALFPHLDVAGNVAFALVEAGSPREEVKRRLAEMLDLVGLSGYERRRVFELSGGQQQRVALARALAARPALLLLDEPLSNLDPELRGALQLELREILSGVGVQALYVTHDRHEALALAGRLAVMREGRLVRVGTADEVMESPGSDWAARFLGYRNVFAGRKLAFATPGQGALLVRDDLISPGGALPSRVRSCRRSGVRLHLELDVPEWGVTLNWEGYARELPQLPEPGDELGLDVPAAALVGLDLTDGPDEGLVP